MSEKIRGFIPKVDLDEAKYVKKGLVVHLYYSTVKVCDDDVEIEITMIEPVYEYRFLLISGGVFFLSGGYYKDMDDCKNSINVAFEPIRIIEETKRIRK